MCWRACHNGIHRDFALLPLCVVSSDEPFWRYSLWHEESSPILSVRHDWVMEQQWWQWSGLCVFQGAPIFLAREAEPVLCSYGFGQHFALTTCCAARRYAKYYCVALIDNPRGLESKKHSTPSLRLSPTSSLRVINDQSDHHQNFHKPRCL